MKKVIRNFITNPSPLYYLFPMIAMLLALAILPANAQDTAPDDPPVEGISHQLPGAAGGTGTTFTVTDSDYLNVTLTSSEILQVHLTSMPSIVTYGIEATEDTQSTWITLEGLLTSTKYYMYEDVLIDPVEFTTDANGSHTYVQDTSIHHFVSLQTQPSTIYLPSDTNVGTWDPINRIYTLTQDINDTVYIYGSNFTLEGNGHTIAGTPGTYGIYMASNTGVTIQNLTVTGAYVGISLYATNNCTIINNTFDACSTGGIYEYICYNDTISNNTIINGNFFGLYLRDSKNSILSGNTMFNNLNNFKVEGQSDNNYETFIHTIDTSNTVEGQPILYVTNDTGGVYDASTNAGVFYAINCDGITVKDITTASGNFRSVYLVNTHNSTVENVLASNGDYGMWLRESNNNTIQNNTILDNIYGVYMKGCDDNSLLENTTASNRYGYFLDTVNNNTFSDNISSQNALIGIYLYFGNNNTFYQNTIELNKYVGLYIFYANNNQVYNNNFIDNRTQCYVNASSGNVFNLSSPTGGNHWSNFTTPDANNDGFVDYSYGFYGGRDYLPLVNPYSYTAQRAMVDLLVVVSDLNLKTGIENSLDAKLDSAVKALDDMNENNDVSAINSLQAFINAVEAQRDKAISSADADALIEAAEAIIALIG